MQIILTLTQQEIDDVTELAELREWPLSAADLACAVAKNGFIERLQNSLKQERVNAEFNRQQSLPQNDPKIVAEINKWECKREECDGN